MLNAVVGAAGLDATLAALEAGKRVALANKETLVVAGELARPRRASGGGEIVPVDSEHSAILQCLAGRRPARGAPRRSSPRRAGRSATGRAERLERATRRRRAAPPDVAHGPQDHGRQRDAREQGARGDRGALLFGLPYDRIEVVVHPQSVVHSFVEFVDGSVLAQMGVPTMELPVLYALTHPERVPDTGVPPFDPVAARR